MFFAKNEIIELEDKNYLVLDSTIIDNEVYYKVSEANLEKNLLSEDKLYIQATKESGTLYIEEVKDLDIINKIKELLES